MRLSGAGALLRFTGLVWFLVTALSAAAAAATLTYEATVGGETREITVSSLDVDGVQYFPLRVVASKLGGGCQVVGGRAQVDLVSQTAWIGINDTAVDGSVSRFALSRPIVRQGDEVLMAVKDLFSFFRQAFHIQFTSKGTTPAAPADPPKAAEPILPAGDTEPATGSAGGVVRPISVVIIDPGHGGANTGTENDRGYKEKDLTLAIAKQLKKALEQSQSFKVLLTRDSDIEVPLRDRVNFATKNKGDLYLSLHAGASLSTSVSGLALFIPARGEAAAAEGRAAASSPQLQQDYSGPSLRIATEAAASLGAATSAPVLGVRPLRTRVMRGLAMPSVLIEVGCLTNADEGAQLQTEAYQAKIAAGLAEAVLRFAAPPAGGVS
ncbi:MAG: N-acetylmuramoyl-L-alanine amidase [Candidatus Hydrogenedentes bacterium]|nr:N-acetylmuramoyl-L-alanine amidase [Candidatus Hydrogenedentota bacterium]